MSWRDLDGEAGDGDLDGPLERRRLHPAVVVVAWLVVWRCWARSWRPSPS